MNRYCTRIDIVYNELHLEDSVYIKCFLFVKCDELLLCSNPLFALEELSLIIILKTSFLRSSMNQQIAWIFL